MIFKLNNSKSKSFDQWYLEIIEDILISRSNVHGSIFILPYGMKIWNLIKSILTEFSIHYEIEEIQTPTLIQKEDFYKEINNIDGLVSESIECNLKGKKHILRPTSEILFCELFLKYLKSYKDLPIKLMQYCSVFRKEIRPRILLRNIEFLWQESHGIFDTNDSLNEALSYVLNDIYLKFFTDYLAISPIVGYKSKKERFAGASETYTCEVIVSNGKAIQSATAHNLSTVFTEIFNIKYLSKEHTLIYPYQGSWGISTRLLAILAMIHGDDYGLSIPPYISPVQVVIIAFDNDEPYVKNIYDRLLDLNVRISIDKNKKDTFSKRVLKYCREGVPIQVHIGNKEINDNLLTVFTRYDMNYLTVSSEDIDSIQTLLRDIQIDMKKRSEKITSEFNVIHMTDDTSIEYLVESTPTIVYGNILDKEEMLNEYGVSIRCIVTDGLYKGGALIAKSY